MPCLVIYMDILCMPWPQTGELRLFTWLPSPFVAIYIFIRYSHEYWWAGCGRNGCPVAAGHCGKLAASLIVIHSPSSASIKGRKDDTFGGTCSSEYVCMKRWRESKCVRVCAFAYIEGHKTTLLLWKPPQSEHRRLWPRISESVMEWGLEMKWAMETRWYLSVWESVCPFICSTLSFNRKKKLKFH